MPPPLRLEPAQSPEKFRPFLTAANGDIPASLDMACGFNSQDEYVKNADICLEFIAYLKTSVGYGPTPLTQLYSGRAYMAKGVVAKADAAFKEAERERSLLHRAYALRGMGAAYKGDRSGARTYFEKALQLEPRYAFARVLFCNMLLAGSMFAEVLLQAEEGLKFAQDDKTRAAMLSFKSYALDGLGRLDEVLKTLAEMEKLEPIKRDPSLRYDYAMKRGNILRSQNRFSESVAAYEEAINIYPDRVNPYLDKAQTMAFLRGGMDDEVRRVVRKGESLCKDDKCTAMYKLMSADTLFTFGQDKEALENLNWLEERKLHTRARHLLMASYFLKSLGSKDKLILAEGHLKEAEALGRDHLSVILRALVEAKMDPEAFRYPPFNANTSTFLLLINLLNSIGAYLNALKRQVSDTEEYLQASVLASALGRNQRVLEFTGEYIKLAPSNYRGHFFRGKALNALDRNDEAADALKRAVELKPAGVEDHKLHCSYAFSLLGTNEYALALKHFDEALRIEPTDMNAEIKRCLALEGLGRRGEALAAIEVVLKKYPDNGEAFRIKGELLERMDRIDEGRALLEKAVELEPGNWAAHNAFGLALLSAGEPAKAEREFSRAIELNSEFEGAQSNRAIAFVLLSRLDEAGQLLALIERKYPNSTSYLLPKAMFESASGNGEAALKFFELAAAATTRKETLRVISTHKAATLIDLERYKEANDIFTRAAAQGPLGAADLYLFGYSLFKFGDLKGAAQRFEEMERKIGTMRERSRYYFGMSALRAAEKKYIEAVQLIDKALEFDPKDVDFKGIRVQYLVLAGKKKEALEGADALLRADPNNGSANHVKGYLLLTEGKYAEAAPYCKRAVEKWPKNAYAQTNMAIIAYEQGRFDDAIAHCAAAKKADPSFAGSYFTCARAYKAKGDMDRASEEYRITIEKGGKEFNVYYEKGNVELSRGKFKEAVAELNEALRLAPSARDRLDTLKGLGWANLRMGRYDEAKTIFKELLGTPLNDMGRYGLAAAAAESGERAGAIELYRRVLEGTDPSLQAAAHHDIAIIMVLKGNKDEALAEFDRAIAVDREHAPSYVGKAALLLDRGKADEAERVLREVLGKRGGPLDSFKGMLKMAHFLMGVVMLRISPARPADAEKELRGVIDEEPEPLETRMFLVEALLRQKKADKALLELGEIIRRDADNAKGFNLAANTIRGTIYLDHMGNGQEALRIFTQVMMEDPKNGYIRYLIAKAEHKLGRHDDALKDLNQDWVGKLGISDPYLLKAQVEFRKGMYENVLASLDTARTIGKFADPNAVSSNENMMSELRKSLGAAKLARIQKFCDDELKRCTKFGVPQSDRGCYHSAKICGWVNAHEQAKLFPVIPGIKLGPMELNLQSAPRLPQYDTIDRSHDGFLGPGFMYSPPAPPHQ